VVVGLVVVLHRPLSAAVAIDVVVVVVAVLRRCTVVARLPLLDATSTLFEPLSRSAGATPDEAVSTTTSAPSPTMRNLPLPRSDVRARDLCMSGPFGRGGATACRPHPRRTSVTES
jgi:hypothetical protein